MNLISSSSSWSQISSSFLKKEEVRQVPHEQLVNPRHMAPEDLKYEFQETKGEDTPIVADSQCNQHLSYAIFVQKFCILYPSFYVCWESLEVHFLKKIIGDYNTCLGE